MVTRIGRWIACLLLVTLPVAGCNRGGDADEPTTQASPSAATARVSPSPSPSPSPDGETYTVESGDTLSDIARRFNTSVEAIVEVNDLDDPDVLSIGDKLIIPSGDGSG